jgi:hypothetical protein
MTAWTVPRSRARRRRRPSPLSYFAHRRPQIPHRWRRPFAGRACATISTSSGAFPSGSGSSASTSSITVFSTPSSRVHILVDRTPYPGSSVSFFRKPKRIRDTACSVYQPRSTTHGSDRRARNTHPAARGLGAAPTGHRSQTQLVRPRLARSPRPPTPPGPAASPHRLPTHPPDLAPAPDQEETDPARLTRPATRTRRTTRPDRPARHRESAAGVPTRPRRTTPPRPPGQPGHRPPHPSRCRPRTGPAPAPGTRHPASGPHSRRPRPTAFSPPTSSLRTPSARSGHTPCPSRRHAPARSASPGSPRTPPPPGPPGKPDSSCGNSAGAPTTSPT